MRTNVQLYGTSYLFVRITPLGEKIIEGLDVDEQASSQQVETWQQEQERLESELAHQIPEMNLARRFQQADRRAVAMALPPNTFLIEFISLNAVDFHAIPAQQQRHWQPARYIAFILKAQEPDTVQLIDLGEAAVIDQHISAFRSAIMRREPIHVPANDEEEKGGERHGARTFVLLEPHSDAETIGTQNGFFLRRALFDPLLPALSGCTHLLLAPDGDLAWVPFSTLPQEDGSYLIDDYQITYVTTGRDVLRLTNEAITQPSPALVIADPDFDLHLVESQESTAFPQRESATRSSGTLDRGTLHFARLSGAQAEGEKIANLLQVTPLVRERALDRYIKSCRSPFILHIATHGFFLPDQSHGKEMPIKWGGIEQEESATGRLERLSQRHIANPLLRSWLVLAGVNTWSRGEALPLEAEDGLLSAEDVASMDLTGTELAFLSACETGLGHVHIGEGVFGLRRAFVLAGAKTLVMSLWKVDDQQTQTLMLDFYRRILEGQPRASALRAAQLALKHIHPHPYYWGAFICQGAAGPLPAFPPANQQETIPPS